MCGPFLTFGLLTQEIKAFIALVLVTGVVTSPSYEMYLSQNKFVGNTGIKKVMSRGELL